MTQSSSWEEGRACPLCPGTSDVHLLGDSEGIVHLDSKVANGALDLSMAQQELDGSQVAGSSVDEGSFRPSQRVGAVEGGVQANSGDLAGGEPGVLPSCQRPSGKAAAREEVAAGFLGSLLHVGIDGFPGLLGELEPHRMSGLSLTQRGAIEGYPVRGDVLDPRRDDFAAAQLVVDRQVKHGQIPQAIVHLELGPD